MGLIFFSCKKSADVGELKLLRTEATDYNGKLLATEYEYDNMNRVVTIKQSEDNAATEVAVLISYNGNEAILTSFPKNEPAYNQTKKVLLMFDPNRRTLKKIAYTHGIPINAAAQTPQIFVYDTLLYSYNPDGLLKEVKRTLYDSSWQNQANNYSRKLNSTITYTIQANNATASDEYSIYNSTLRQGGVTTFSGGSSEYHNVFSYTKSYPNQMDFKNAALLNEFLDYYELVLDVQYKNMPDRVVRNSLDKDMNGATIFTGSTIVEIERSYNDDGLLSSVNIPTATTQFRKIKYFYGR